MGIAQYTDKIKALTPSFKALPVKVTLPPVLLEKFSLIDKRQLLIACSGVLGFYALVFTYVYFTAEKTIAKMEEKMATVSVELTEKAIISHSRLGSHNASKPDLKPNEMANANLIEGLLHYDSMFGRLPIIRSGDRLTSFRAYQTPFSLEGIGNKPVISFVLKDFGLSDKASNMALDILPPEVSFLLSPYADLPQEWINRARAAGHEVWMELPIQQDKRSDTGLNTIYHHDSLAEKGKAMRVSLARGLGYVGVGFFMDRGVKETKEHYIKLIEELYGRGLAALELNSHAPTFIEVMAITKAAPFIKTTGEIERASGVDPFLTIEKTAQESRQAIALVPPYPVMIKDLALWIEKVGKVDYVISPASAIYDLPLARSGVLLDTTENKAQATTHKTPRDLGKNDRIEPEERSHGH